jgi:hypothetical protein
LGCILTWLLTRVLISHCWRTILSSNCRSAGMMTSLTKIGGYFGLTLAVSGLKVSEISSAVSAEKRFLVVVGWSQWLSSLECLASRVESSSRGRPLLLETFVQGWKILGSEVNPLLGMKVWIVCASRYKSNGKASRTAFCVARHPERLSYLGTSLPSLSTL